MANMANSPEPLLSKAVTKPASFVETEAAHDSEIPEKQSIAVTETELEAIDDELDTLAKTPYRDEPEHETSLNEKRPDATLDGTATKLPADLEQHTNPRWGRFNNSSWAVSLGCLGIMTICPVLVILGWIALSSFNGSLCATLRAVFAMGPLTFAVKYAPRLTAKAAMGYSVWLAFQAALYEYLPSRVCFGQRTPAGHLLPYRVNGLLAWAVTHVLVAILTASNVLDPAFIAKNWEGLLVALNLYGFLLPAVAYFKAHWAPTHKRDRKFSGQSSGEMQRHRRGLTCLQDLACMTFTWGLSSTHVLESGGILSSSIMAAPES